MINLDASRLTCFVDSGQSSCQLLVHVIIIEPSKLVPFEVFSKCSNISSIKMLVQTNLMYKNMFWPTIVGCKQNFVSAKNIHQQNVGSKMLVVNNESQSI